MTGWTGGYVRDAVGVGLRRDDARSLVPVDRLVGLALRRNPRRAHLLVSQVLAKHVPTVPALAVVAGRLLGLLVADALAADGDDARRRRITSVAGAVDAALASPAADREAVRRALADANAMIDDARAERHDVLTIGYAETATGLGHLVADVVGSRYLHSTRHAVDAADAGIGFEEEHSHATSHRLHPAEADLVPRGGTVVLVDDELSTGTTVVNTIRAMHASAPQERWVVAALVDLRSAADRARFDDLAEELGTSIDVVALGAGAVDLPADVAERARAVIEAIEPGSSGGATPGDVTVVEAAVPPIRSARFGVAGRLDDGLARSVAVALDPAVPSGDVLVLGSEEFIALPMLVAGHLDGPGRDVRFSTTTRSPVAPIDRPDYAIASAVAFTSHDRTVDGPGPRYAYNLVRDGRAFDAIVLLPEPGVDRDALLAPGGVVEALRRVAPHVVVGLLAEDAPAAPAQPGHRRPEAAAPAAGPLPEPLRGPAFGSYAPDEVAWLLTDLGDVRLEAPSAEREAAIQSGRANYAESLPIEYTPSAEYEALYRAALDASARRVAIAVGVVTELVTVERGGAPVLVSLARAGAPIGVLMRRWARHAHGVDLDHYTMSIVRGVGIDPVALRYLATHHDPSRVAFVDGWTGKGAITRELTAALDAFEASEGVRFPEDLAVLADPGSCVRTFGTRDDYLIPSACLNSTVSGLVSRTVFNRELIGPDDYHGAKFYAELADHDVSGAFLDAVSGWFDDVGDDVRAGVEAAATVDREPTWAGWAAVERISEAYGIGRVNLVKPGVGETTRVLLRRVPWRVLVRPDATADIAHVLLLAEQRGVPVEAVDDLPYSSVGLIKPHRDDPADGGAL